jgi:hypothetical protein
MLLLTPVLWSKTMVSFTSVSSPFGIEYYLLIVKKSSLTVISSDSGAWAARYVSRCVKVSGLLGSLSISLLMSVMGESVDAVSVWLSSLEDFAELVFALIISSKRAYSDFKLLIISLCFPRTSYDVPNSNLG